MKTIKLIALCLLFSTSLLAQTFEVPANYSFKTEADFSKHENTILECTSWLMNTPIDTEKEKRKKASLFLLDFVSGSKIVKAELNGEITPFVSNHEFMVIFLASWTKSCLTQNYANNRVEFTARATQSVIEFYKKNKANLNKTEKLNPFLELQNQGKLENHFIETMK